MKKFHIATENKKKNKKKYFLVSFYYNYPLSKPTNTKNGTNGKPSECANSLSATPGPDNTCY